LMLSGTDEFAVVLTEDFEAVCRGVVETMHGASSNTVSTAARAASVIEPPSRPGHGRPPPVPPADYRLLMDNFLHKLCPACCHVSVRKDTLLRHAYYGHTTAASSGDGRVASGGGGGGGASGGGGDGGSHGFSVLSPQTALTFLVHCGLLLGKHGDPDVYWLAVPRAGHFVR
jgi:uncharacterized membrane protein YgcG